MRWEEISGTGASGPPGRRCAGPARGSPAAGGGGAAAAAARPFRRWSAAMGGRRTGSGPPRWGSGRSLGLRLRRAAAPCGWGRRGRAGEWRGGRDRGRSAAPPPPALPRPRPRRRARTGGGSPGVSSEKTAPAPPQRAPLPPQLSLWEGAGGTSPPPPVCPGVGGGWGIADSDGKGGGLPLEGGLREGQRRWDAKGKSAARKRGLRGGLGLCFLFALKWWKFGDALARCLHRLRCPSGLMRVVLVWQEGQVAFVGVPEEDCSAAVV